MNNKIVVMGEERQITCRFNITLKTLEDAVKFAKANPDGHTECFSFAVHSGDIGSAFFIGKRYDSDHKNITDINSW